MINQNVSEVTRKKITELYQELCAYGNLRVEEKILVVSGVLMVLKFGFSVDVMQGDNINTDGTNIWNNI